MTNKLRKKMYITFSFLVGISILVFSIVCFINWSLLTGFLLGTSVSFLMYLLNEIYVSHLLSKRRSFKFAFFAGVTKSLILVGLVIAILTGVLFANKQLKSSWINGVFNVFTFIYGTTTIPIAIIIYNLVDIVRKKDKRKKVKGV